MHVMCNMEHMIVDGASRQLSDLQPQTIIQLNILLP